MKTIRPLLIPALALLLAACATVPAPPGAEARAALAPTGKLRVGLYLGGPTNIVPGATPAETRGVGYDLGNELARRLGVPFVPVVYPTAGGVIDGLKSGEWDLAFLAFSPARMDIVDFSTPFLSIEHGYLVAPGSSLATVADVDRLGVRIGAPQGGSVNAALAQAIRNAQVVPTAGLAGGAAMLQAGKIDAFAANKANLFELADKMPGYRVLPGRFGLDRTAIAVPTGRAAGIVYVRQFVAEAKGAGLIDAAVRRARLRGAIDR